MKIAASVAALFLLSTSAWAGDAIGTMKPWGTVDVTLQKVDFRGSAVSVALLLKNNVEKPENISSLMQFQMLSDQGDKGDMQMMAKCDGSIPPLGVMKCLLTYTFPQPPAGVSLQVGAGFGSDPVFFNLTK